MTSMTSQKAKAAALARRQQERDPVVLARVRATRDPNSPHAGARVLVVRQPFAELIASGRKTVELRSKPTRWRGPVLILAAHERHAAWTDGSLLDGLDRTALARAPVGRAVCVVDLVGSRPATPADENAACLLGIPETGWHAWLLGRPDRVEQRPTVGRQALYYPDDELLELIRSVRPLLRRGGTP